MSFNQLRTVECVAACKEKEKAGNGHPNMLLLKASQHFYQGFKSHSAVVRNSGKKNPEIYCNPGAFGVFFYNHIHIKTMGFLSFAVCVLGPFLCDGVFFTLVVFSSLCQAYFEK